MRTGPSETVCFESCFAGFPNSLCSVKMSEVKKPISFSPVIRLNNKIYIKNENLQTKVHFDREFTYWGILYTFVPLSGSSEAVSAMNNSLSAYQADGMVNFKISAEGCGLNGLTGAVLGILPFMPGCVNVRYEADLVAISGEGK